LANITYVVTVSDNCGSTPITDSVQVVVNPGPIVNFTGTPVHGCTPLTVQFTDSTISNLTGLVRSWNFGDGSTFSDSLNPVHIYTMPGTYTVTEIVHGGSSNCVASHTDSAMITVYPIPVPGFVVSPPMATLLTPQIDINDLSSGATIWSYTFGDGTGSNLENPKHSYTDTGIFWIDQIVWNQWGCVDSTRGTVIINPDYAFYIPNAFTPGTGLNYTFQGYGTGIIQYEMNIFDRWGEEIFHTVDINNPWDGTYNGTNVNQGIYVYEIKITTQDHASHQYAGKVTLIR
jgi:gliding motility-associated-like protein